MRQFAIPTGIPSRQQSSGFHFICGISIFFKPDYPFKAKVTLGSPITRFKSDSVTPSDGTNTIDFYTLLLFALLDSAPESHRVLVLHQVPQESVSFLAHVVQINVRHRVA